MADKKFLAIYLNDHLAGATAALEVVRRSISSNEGTETGNFLSGLAEEIQADREALVDVMRRLGVGQDRVKLAGAWLAEKVGRLKLNGQLTGYSPLSRLVELESLKLGVTGKLVLWRSLEHISRSDEVLAEVDFDRLAKRAEEQLEELERMRLRAVERALPVDPG